MKLFTRSFLTMMVAFLIAQGVTAQSVNQGAWMIGGTAGFASQKFKDADESTTFLDISPLAGYYVIDNLAVGLGVSFTSVSFDGESTSTTSLSPFARYYVFNPFFLQAGVDLGLDEGAGTAFTAALGYSWFLNNSVAIEPALFYSSYGAEGDANDYSIFGLSIGVQAFLGRNE